MQFQGTAQQALRTYAQTCNIPAHVMEQVNQQQHLCQYLNEFQTSERFMGEKIFLAQLVFKDVDHVHVASYFVKQAKDAMVVEMLGTPSAEQVASMMMKNNGKAATIAPWIRILQANFIKCEQSFASVTPARSNPDANEFCYLELDWKDVQIFYENESFKMNVTSLIGTVTVISPCFTQRYNNDKRLHAIVQVTTAAREQVNILIDQAQLLYWSLLRVGHAYEFVGLEKCEVDAAIQFKTNKKFAFAYYQSQEGSQSILCSQVVEDSVLIEQSRVHSQPSQEDASALLIHYQGVITCDDDLAACLVLELDSNFVLYLSHYSLMNYARCLRKGATIKVENVHPILSENSEVHGFACCMNTSIQIVQVAAEYGKYKPVMAGLAKWSTLIRNLSLQDYVHYYSTFRQLRAKFDPEIISNLYFMFGSVMDKKRKRSDTPTLGIVQHVVQHLYNTKQEHRVDSPMEQYIHHSTCNTVVPVRSIVTLSLLSQVSMEQAPLLGMMHYEAGGIRFADTSSTISVVLSETGKSWLAELGQDWYLPNTKHQHIVLVTKYMVVGTTLFVDEAKRIYSITNVQPPKEISIPPKAIAQTKVLLRHVFPFETGALCRCEVGIMETSAPIIVVNQTYVLVFDLPHIIPLLRVGDILHLNQVALSQTNYLQFSTFSTIQSVESHKLVNHPNPQIGVPLHQVLAQDHRSGDAKQVSFVANLIKLDVPDKCEMTLKDISLGKYEIKVFVEARYFPWLIDLYKHKTPSQVICLYFSKWRCRVSQNQNKYCTPFQGTSNIHIVIISEVKQSQEPEAIKLNMNEIPRCMYFDAVTSGKMVKCHVRTIRICNITMNGKTNYCNALLLMDDGASQSYLLVTKRSLLYKLLGWTPTYVNYACRNFFRMIELCDQWLFDDLLTLQYSSNNTKFNQQQSKPLFVGDTADSFYQFYHFVEHESQFGHWTIVCQLHNKKKQAQVIQDLPCLPSFTAPTSVATSKIYLECIYCEPYYKQHVKEDIEQLLLRFEQQFI